MARPANLPMSSDNDAGRTVRRVASAVVVLLLLAATGLHLLMLPEKQVDSVKEPVSSPPVVEEPTTQITSPPVRLIQYSDVVATADANRDTRLNAKRAFGYLKQLCDLGPRPSGSRAMRAQQELLVEHFEALGAEVKLQRFKARHPLDQSRVPMANLIVKWRPELKQRVLLCAHYDTRPLPDRDPNPIARRNGRFIGANDGASGTALLMELAHLLQNYDGDLGVDVVLFDGEELVYQDPRDPYFLGSQWFGRRYAKRKPKDWSYRWAILFDMVGDADLQMYWEKNSYQSKETRPLLKELWATAQRLGIKEFVPRVKHEVLDDHLALQKYGGIPAIDLIDFD